jgi:hypothetical protein
MNINLEIKNNLLFCLDLHLGELKLVNCAAKGGIEELRASADAIAKIAKKISSLNLGEKHVMATRVDISISKTS